MPQNLWIESKFFPTHKFQPCWRHLELTEQSNSCFTQEKQRQTGFHFAHCPAGVCAYSCSPKILQYFPRACSKYAEINGQFNRTVQCAALQTQFDIHTHQCECLQLCSTFTRYSCMVWFLGFSRALTEFLQHCFCFPLFSSRISPADQNVFSCLLRCVQSDIQVCNLFYPRLQTCTGMHKMKFLQETEVQVIWNVSKEHSFSLLPYCPLLSLNTWKNNENIARWKIHLLEHVRHF